MILSSSHKNKEKARGADILKHISMQLVPSVPRRTAIHNLTVLSFRWSAYLQKFVKQ